MSKYDECATKVKNALDYTYEEKANKKDSLDNDYSTDTTSYPTCKAVNEAIGGITTPIVTSWESTLSDTKVPSEKLTKNSLDAKANSTHSHQATEVTDSNSDNYTNIGTLSADATQQSINNAINTQLGSLLNIDLIVVVASLPTASADTMNKIYLLANSSSTQTNQYNEYITVRTGTSPNYSYDWEDLGTVSIDLSNYIQKSLTSGLIKNDGTVDTTSYISSIPTGSTSQAGIVQLVDDLSTNDNTKALTAKQGKVLYDLVDDFEVGTFTELGNEITNAITNNNGVLILNRDYKRVSSDSQISSQLTSNLLIIGNGHTIDCNSLGRFLYVNNNVKVELNDLNIINGLYSNQGGAIYINTGSCILNKCEITNNQVTNGAGGAIFTNSSLIVNDCIFNKNTSDGVGGAIRLYEGELTVKNTIFDNNSANNGGGISARVGGFTVINCEFKNNIAANNNYASIYSVSDTNTVINCTIPLNTSYGITNNPYLTISTLPTGSTSQAGIVQIVDNLTTDDNTKVLSAKQGKAIADMIGTAISYIQQ